MTDLRSGSTTTRNSLLRELSTALSRRKALYEQVGHLHSEVQVLERVAVPRGKENGFSEKFRGTDIAATSPPISLKDIKLEKDTDALHSADEKSLIHRQEWSLPVRIPLKDVSRLDHQGSNCDLDPHLAICSNVSSKDSGIASADSQTGSERDVQSPMISNAYSPISRPSSADSLDVPAAVEYPRYSIEPLNRRDDDSLVTEQVEKMTAEHFQNQTPNLDRSEELTEDGDNARAPPVETKKSGSGGSGGGSGAPASTGGGLILNLGSLLASAVKAANLKAEEMKHKKAKRKPSPAVEDDSSGASLVKRSCHAPSETLGTSNQTDSSIPSVALQDRRTSSVKLGE